MEERLPIVAPQTFGDLSDLEYFAITARGNLIKGRLPILIAPDESGHMAEAAHFGATTPDDPLTRDSNLDDIRRAVEFDRPQIVEPQADADRVDSPRPVKRSFLPLVRWIDVLPAFRPEDPKPEIKPDPYTASLEEAERPLPWSDPLRHPDDEASSLCSS